MCHLFFALSVHLIIQCSIQISKEYAEYKAISKEGSIRASSCFYNNR